MIQIIGLIISCYTVTRLISLITRTGERKESALTVIIAVLALLATLLLIFLLIVSGVTG